MRHLSSHPRLHDRGWITSCPSRLPIYLRPRGNRRRFKEAEITIAFSAGDVQSIALSRTWATFQSEKQRELTHSVSPSLEAAFGPGKATLGYTWQLKESSSVEGHSSVVGFIQTLGQAGSARKRANTVFWGLYENPQTESGILSFMQTAVLLKRNRTRDEPLGQNFSAEIVIRGEIHHQSVKDKMLGIAKKMTGKSRKGEDVIFNRRIWNIQEERNLLKKQKGKSHSDEFLQLVRFEGSCLSRMLASNQEERRLLMDIKKLKD
ncbi:hypothetical protein B0H63DRAFT_487889 [Podospora didyma]|uniref:Uncharacterized protein n=1 Tax=Podospora didyma TaxID=330526 RepID=A0AAE0K243_9PEZI|nr:hypothetical protein B0H63DRAFT_487889 [Podospora didyma]